MPRRRTTTSLGLAALLALASAGACGGDGGGGAGRGTTAPATGTTAVPSTATTGPTSAVGGTVWHDADGDGTRDPGEPGVPAVVIALAGTATTTATAADGTWTLALPDGRHTLSAITGWLPSACPGDLDCAAGRTPDQDFAVQNQFVRASVTVGPGADPAPLDLGLLPDHGDPGGGAIDGNDPGDGPAAATDVAVRHSAAGGGFAACPDAGDVPRVCPVGARATTNLQVYAQGTQALSGLRLAVVVPSGARLVAPPAVNPSTPGPGLVADPVTGGSGRVVAFTLPGSLAPAAARWFRLEWEVTAPPDGPVAGRFAVHAHAGVTAMAAADVDATLHADPSTALDRGHNVNWPAATDDDSTDSVGWNVG